MPRFQRFLLPILSFGISKASVLFAPLLLAGLIPLSAYGRLESHLAWAALLAPLLALGLPAAVPYFLLKQQKPSYKPLIALCTTVVGGVAVVLYAGCLFFGVNHPALSIVVIGTAFALQFVWSAFLKSEGRPALASILDGGFYLLLLLFALACFLLTTATVLPWLDTLIGLYLLLLCGIGGLLIWQGSHLLQQLHSADAPTLFQYSLPYVLPGLGMLAIVNGGRIMGQHWLGTEAVGIYAFLFRLAAPAIVIHQLLANLFFKRLYIAPANKLDTYFPAVIITVLLIGGVSALMLPLVQDYWPMLQQLGHSDWQVQRLLVMQMALWVAIALNEPIIARENKIWTQLIILAGVALLGFLGAYFILSFGWLNLLALCQVQLAVFFSAYISMWGILWRAGVHLPRSCSTVCAIMVIYLLAEALIF